MEIGSITNSYQTLEAKSNSQKETYYKEAQKVDHSKYSSR